MGLVGWEEGVPHPGSHLRPTQTDHPSSCPEDKNRKRFGEQRLPSALWFLASCKLQAAHNRPPPRYPITLRQTYGR